MTRDAPLAVNNSHVLLAQHGHAPGAYVALSKP
jgi:hypothetical protein